MNHFLGIVSLTLAHISYSLAGDLKYPVSDIPDNLQQGMYAVIREEYSKFEIQAVNRSNQYVHRVITILNGKGKARAIEVLGYDKFRRIISFRGTVYDEVGNVLRKLKQNEIIDQSAISGVSLFEDNRLKMADLSGPAYPYTVEFEYEIQMNYLYSIPEFFLYEDDEISIQKSTYTVVYPKQLSPRFKLTSIKEPVKEQRGQNTEAVTWFFENIRPVKFEPYSPELAKIVPNIIAGPVEFEYDGNHGRMDSWENLGQWQVLLNKGREELPEAAVEKVRNLTKEASSIEEKSRILYEYLQNKTRYVSIQRGIGGLQPMESKTVDRLGYGDCKALSNYMVAMLAQVGVKAYYTQIYGGEKPRTVPWDFPIDYFNHIIVGVPNGADTLWLECTSQTNPFGYLGSFTGDRQALMITENGGKLVRTISYRGNQNVQTNMAEVFVEPTGDAKAKITTEYKGLQYENGGLNFVLNNKYDEQKKWLQRNMKIPSFDVNSFSMTNRKDKIPSAIVVAELTLRRYASVSGKRLFLTPNLLNRSGVVPEKLDERKTKVMRKMAYIDFDTIRYHLPEQLYPEFLPSSLKFESRFGDYESSFRLEQGKLVYTRRLKMNKGEFPADSYNELIEFYKNINKADHVKLVFLNKT